MTQLLNTSFSPPNLLLSLCFPICRPCFCFSYLVLLMAMDLVFLFIFMCYWVNSLNNCCNGTSRRRTCPNPNPDPMTETESRPCQDFSLLKWWDRRLWASRFRFAEDSQLFFRTSSHKVHKKKEERCGQEVGLLSRLEGNIEQWFDLDFSSFHSLLE